MGDREDNEVGGTSLPTSSNKRPTIIRGTKTSLECPLRPVSTPQPLTGITGPVKPCLATKKKPEITIVDARPMSEVGFKNIKSPTMTTAPAVKLSLPSSGVNNKTVKEHEQITFNKTGFPPDEVDDSNADDDMVVVRKPSVQQKPQKPTIIRPQSRLHSSTDLTPAAEVSPESTQNNSFSSSSSFVATQSPAVPNLLEPTPKLRSVIPEKKPKPPVRPPSMSASDSSSQKTTLDKSVNGQTGPSLATKIDVVTDDKTPSSNLTSPTTTTIHPPKRPSGPPRPNLPENLKPNQPVKSNSISSRDTENQISQRASKSIDSPKYNSIASGTQGEHSSYRKEDSENKTAVPKPKPRPKARPPNLTSTDNKGETQAIFVDSAHINTKKQLPSSDQHVQSVHDTIQNFADHNIKPSFSTRTCDTINQEVHSPMHEKPKPSSMNVTSKTETTKTTELDNKKPGILTSNDKKPGIIISNDKKPGPPARPPSIATPQLQPTSARMPTPPSRAKHQESDKENPVVKTPHQPDATTPAGIKSTPSYDKPQKSSDSVSSSLDVKSTDMTKPSQPTTSRVKQTAGVPPLPNRPGPGHSLYSYISKEPHGIALHNFTAGNPDELSFSEGDVVLFVKEVDENWKIGQVGDNVGMYPAAFVEMKKYPVVDQKSNYPIDSLDFGAASTNKKLGEDISGPRCKARFDFEGDEEGELALHDGDVVEIVEKVSDEWLRGKHRGRHGIFPTSFVEIIEDLPAGDDTSNSVHALFDFEGKDGELTFKTGDKITDIRQVDSKWLFGHCNDQKGQFPASFVSTLPLSLPKYEVKLPAEKGKQHEQKAERNGATKNLKTVSVPGDEFWESRETGLGFCIAIYDYNDPAPGDLNFKARDRIEIVEFIGEDWARGRLRNKEGMFPLRFVAEELNSPPRTPEPEIVKKVFGKVLHDFDGETADDLVIKEGDLIEIGDFADINKNWRWGTLNGKKGMFPATFVDIIE